MPPDPAPHAAKPRTASGAASRAAAALRIRAAVVMALVTLPVAARAAAPTCSVDYVVAIRRGGRGAAARGRHLRRRGARQAARPAAWLVLARPHRPAHSSDRRAPGDDRRRARLRPRSAASAAALRAYGPAPRVHPRPAATPPP